MAIQQLGESLLADVRQRRERENRQLRKKQEREALLKLGLDISAKIGNEMLASKTQDFLNNEQVWGANQAQKQARYNSSQILEINKKIMASGGDARSWAAEQMRPDFEARAEEILADEYTGEAGPYQALVRQKVDELADEWAVDFETALEFANSIASEDDYNKMVALNASKARPADIGSFVTRGVANLFGGKSQEDVQREAIVAVTEGRMAQNADKLNLFMDTFYTTGDMVRAYNISEVVFPEVELSEDERYEIKREDKIAKLDDRIIVYQQTTKTERNTGKVLIEIERAEEGKKPQVLFQKPMDNDAILLDTMKGLNSAWNYAEKGRTMMTSETFAAFATEAVAAGLSIEAPKSVEEHTQVGLIFSKYLTDPLNLEDNYRNQKTIKTFELMTGDPEELQVLLNSVLVEEDPAKRQKGLEMLTAEIARKLFYAEQIIQGQSLDYTATFGSQ